MKLNENGIITDRNGGDDGSVSVEERRRFGRHVGQIGLQEKFFLARQLGRFGRLARCSR